MGLHKNIWSDSTEITFAENIFQNKRLLFTCQIGYIAWAKDTYNAYNAQDTIFNNKMNLNYILSLDLDYLLILGSLRKPRRQRGV